MIDALPLYFLSVAVALAGATLLGARLSRGVSLPPDHRRFGAIDGLRGYLALAVMGAHFFVWTQSIGLGGQWAAPAVGFVNQMGLGSVALFFMITGFLFYPRILKGIEHIDFVSLYVARIFRILPLVIVSVVVITTIIYTRTRIAPGWELAPAWVRWISGWDEPDLLGYADSGRLNAYVLWSLYYEWVFYLILLPATALLVSVARRLNVPSWMVPVGLVVAAIVARKLMGQGSTHPGIMKYLPLFFFGMIAFECQARPALAARLRGPVAGALAAVGLLGGMIWQSHPFGGALPLFAFFFICVACGNTIFGMLRTRGALVLGECSFGIYLLHGILLDALFVSLLPAVPAPSMGLLAVLLPVIMLAVVLVSAGAHLLIERPGIEAGKTLTRRLRRPTSQTNTAGST